ncbi:hypothetical protein B4098_2180 [Heyndrickxia coagulans]|uniref:Uncharacterized protein n=1 Tax=Heyndrickxia coagulans TaxID=1398 RepID=A0A150K2R8_HEYCO|nr:hypothetical protein B4098_2180 [Heyndrickxia coagulans]
MTPVENAVLKNQKNMLKPFFSFSFRVKKRGCSKPYMRG